METTAVDRPETRLAQRLISLQRRLGTGGGRPGDAREATGALVVTAAAGGRDLDGTGRGGIDLAPALELLRESRAATVVVVSSALVYGAWADNPVPLTEQAPLRPRRDSPQAVGYAELERVAATLRSPGRTVAVLRPTVCIDPGARHRRRDGASRWLERSLWLARAQDGHDRPAQFLHVEDLVRAIEHARLRRLDGAFNVAPTGWLSAREQLDLVGSAVEVRVPGRVRRLLEASRTRLARGAGRRELTLVEHPWVLGTDRLRATGWEAGYTNEEAFVLGHRPGWWSTLTPDQRQVVSLGALGAGAGAALWAGIAVARRALRGRALSASARGAAPRP
jgi:hypothetical protein